MNKRTYAYHKFEKMCDAKEVEGMRGEGQKCIIACVAEKSFLKSLSCAPHVPSRVWCVLLCLDFLLLLRLWFLAASCAKMLIILIICVDWMGKVNVETCVNAPAYTRI